MPACGCKAVCSCVSRIVLIGRKKGEVGVIQCRQRPRLDTVHIVEVHFVYNVSRLSTTRTHDDAYILLAHGLLSADSESISVLEPSVAIHIELSSVGLGC